MTLPLLISNPHAGLEIPPELMELNILTPQEISEDGDEGARAIYSIEDEVDIFVTTEIARAFVDLNRAVDDRRADGIVKTHTCWQVPVYREPLPEALVTKLLDNYYHPYHAKLTESASQVIMGIDCHTMAAKGPPIGPDPGVERPHLCLSNGEGTTCPEEWLRSLAQCLETTFETSVSLNDPFKGGFITRSHADELPWVQLELSRAPFYSESEKRERLIDALGRWCEGK